MVCTVSAKALNSQSQGSAAEPTSLFLDFSPLTNQNLFTLTTPSLEVWKEIR
jgi:hypothetical protein